MKFTIEYTPLARTDLANIYNYFLEMVSIQKAEQIISDILEKISSLKEIPDRGHFPPELLSMEVFNYKEIHSSVYRIFFSIDGKVIIIHAVLDGRRNITELLAKRLMR